MFEGLFSKSRANAANEQDLTGRKFKVLLGEHQGQIALVEDRSLDGSYIVRMIPSGERVSVSQAQYELVKNMGGIEEIKEGKE